MLSPAPLSERAVGRLVEANLPGADPAFVAACAAASGGNPFIAHELARALRDEGVEPTAGAAGHVRQLVPATVLHSLLTRLGRLGGEAERLAAAVAVLGDGAPLRHAVTLSGLQAGDAEAAADALAAAGLLAAEEPLRFVHPLIATAVYSDLPPFARARAHRTAADVLAADGASVQELASHLRLARAESDPWTVSVLRDAARRGLARGDPDAAAGLLARALAEPPPAEHRPAVLLELAEAEAMGGDARAEGHVTRALEQLTDPAARVPALRALCRIQLVAGDHQAAAVALLESLDEARGAEAQEILAEFLTISRFTAPLLPEVRRRLIPIVEAARGGALPGDPGLLAHVTLDLALGGASPEEVRATAARAVADDPLIDPGGHGMPMGIVVQALCCVDELVAAEGIADAALIAARTRGSFFASSIAHYHRAIARYHRGALADALADLDQALAPWREGWSTGSVWSQALAVHAHVDRGELPSATAMVAEFATRPDTMDVPIALFARARAALAGHDPTAALQDAVTAGHRLAEDFGIDHPGFVPWRLTASIAAAALGERRRAAELADEQLGLARSLGVPRVLGLALRAAAEVAPPPRRITLLCDAADVLALSPSLLERARVLAALGRALWRAGHRSDAQGHLREALQLADRMGATPLAEAVRDDLRATGARPRRAAITGAEALTPAELRVSRLAAQGLTNAQIAQDLFVTAKTVQTHLAHAYRKLDISSRRDLLRALGEGPAG